MRAKWLTPILNVSDIQQSFAWFAKLGWEKRWDWGDPPDFGAVGSGECEIFLCQDCQGGRGTSGAWLAILVEDVDVVHQHCLAQGLEVTHPPTDEPWNLREMHVRHPDGHVFRIGQGRPATEPRLKIERVDLPVRLEKRLAALLADLAQHKEMTLSECLEETLLHTFEKVEQGGVASPHTQRTLNHIQRLRLKHGIDYDSHGSYRFVEEP